jgi:hypothetical protein
MFLFPLKWLLLGKNFCDFLVKNGEDKELNEEQFTLLLKDYLQELAASGKPKGVSKKYGRRI